MPRRTLVLASSSPYRRMLLGRLGLPFVYLAPQVDETPREGEAPPQLVMRLAEGKARALAERFPNALIIGADQAAAIDGELLGKPGDYGTAAAQLRRFSGRRLDLYTAVSLLDAAGGTCETACVPCAVYFRQLTEAEIRGYLQAEQPFDCAGSFKCEGLGIALFERVETEDPTALVGLPLIRLAAMLRRGGLDVLAPSPASS